MDLRSIFSSYSQFDICNPRAFQRCYTNLAVPGVHLEKSSVLSDHQYTGTRSAGDSVSWFKIDLDNPFSIEAAFLMNQTKILSEQDLFRNLVICIALAIAFVFSFLDTLLLLYCFDLKIDNEVSEFIN